MATGIGVTKGLQSWTFQNKHIERPMDSAAYEAAHPDDTLVLAGPARKGTANPATSSNRVGTLLAIGMLQSFQLTQSKPTQPMMAIGSGRSFFVSGKSQTQWTIGRLFVNGRNLLRALYHNFVAAGGTADASLFDDPAAASRTSGFFTNLDSELFYVPFGLGILIRNKVHALVGAMYVELCMVNSQSIGFTAGQNAILENVSGVADRALPWTNVADSVGVAGVPRATLDAVLDFSTDDSAQVPADSTGQSQLDGLTEGEFELTTATQS